MTPDDPIAELRRLEADATPGPWVATSDDDHERNDVVTCSQVAYVHNKHVSMYVFTEAAADPYRSDTPWADAQLIATARNALPALLDRLERAEAVVAVAEGVGMNWKLGAPYGFDALNEALDAYRAVRSQTTETGEEEAGA